MADNFPTQNIWSTLINLLYSKKIISVPQDYHSRCQGIKLMLDNDITGIINTVLDYSVESAAQAKYKVECPNNTLQELLNLWLSRINLYIPGIPTGLNELSKEYYKERWQGSSLCLLKYGQWEEISLGNVSIEVPTVLWFMNGGSVYINRPDEANYKLGTDKYYFDDSYKQPIVKGDNNLIVQKPYNRWFDKYSTPYLIRKGVYKNYLVTETLASKGEEVISKVIPYLFLLIKNTEKLMAEGKKNYTTSDLKEAMSDLKCALNSYDNQQVATPISAMQADTKYEHFIPDLLPVVTEELYRQSYKMILSGLGFIDIVQGLGNTRRESVLNPQPFLCEVNAGIDGFKEMLREVIFAIAERNIQHKKFFSLNNDIKIIASPIKINTQDILDAIRSGYDRGIVSINTYIESLGFDFDAEREKRKKEYDAGDEDLFYPHLTQNLENIENTNVPTKNRNKDKLEDQGKNPKSPEAQNFKNATIEGKEDLEIAPYSLTEYPEYLKKYPEEARKVWIETWNNVYKETKDEKKAFPIAWNQMQKWLKEHNYKKPKEKAEIEYPKKIKEIEEEYSNLAKKIYTEAITVEKLSPKEAKQKALKCVKSAKKCKKIKEIKMKQEAQNDKRLEKELKKKKLEVVEKQAKVLDRLLNPTEEK